MLHPPQPIFNATVSSTTTYYALYHTPGQGNMSLQAQTVGTAAATSIKVYGSNIYSDYASGGATPSQASLAASFAANEWVEIPTTGGTLPAGANWTDAWNLGKVPFRNVMLVYVNASGTSVLKVFAYGT